MSNCSQSRSTSAKYSRIPECPRKGARIATSVEAGSKTTSSAIRATSLSASRAANARNNGSTISLGAAIRGLATGLLHEHDLGDLEVGLESLDHVIDGQCGHAGRGERLHLDARPSGRPGLGRDGHDAGGGVDVALDADEAQREGVAERDQLGSALRGLDAGQPRGAEDVALRRVAALDGRGGLRRHAYDGAGDGAALGDLLGADVHHPGAPGLVEVGEVAHQAGTAVRWAAAMRSRTACSSPARSSSTGSGSPLTMPSKNALRSW